MNRPRIFSVALTLAMAVLITGCRLKDIRTVTLHSRDVQCPQCARVVIGALADVGSVSRDVPVKEDARASTMTTVWKDHSRSDTAAVSCVVVHYDTGEIDVTYDSMKLAIKNLEFAIAEAGYAVQTRPYDLAANAKARAALPKACRTHNAPAE